MMPAAVRTSTVPPRAATMPLMPAPAGKVANSVDSPSLSAYPSPSTSFHRKSQSEAVVLVPNASSRLVNTSPAVENHPVQSSPVSSHIFWIIASAPPHHPTPTFQIHESLP